MPDIALCLDSDGCSKKKCERHPGNYGFHPYQGYMHLAGTAYCPKTKDQENQKLLRERTVTQNDEQ